MTKYTIKPKLKNSGYPTHSSLYPWAHKKTDKAEKAKYPKGYAEMKKIDAKLSKNELAGKNLRSGKIEVSRKVPKRLRSEVAFHEKTESNLLRKRLKRKG